MGVLWYGSTRYEAGYQARHAVAEAADRIRERVAFEKQKEEQAKADAAAIEHERLKSKTDQLGSDLAAATERLREFTSRKPASCPGPSANTSSPVEDAPDWVGVFGACYAEYGLLAGDAAEVADTLRPLQLLVTP